MRKRFEKDDTTIRVGHVKEAGADGKNNLPMLLVEFDGGDEEDMAIHWSELGPLLCVVTLHLDSEDGEACLPTHYTRVHARPSAFGLLSSHALHVLTHVRVNTHTHVHTRENV